jgi:hypothetical protein
MVYAFKNRIRVLTQLTDCRLLFTGQSNLLIEYAGTA